MDSEQQRRADASFKKEERARDGAKAMMEYEAEALAVGAKTERLRALRLAREAKEAADPTTPVKKKAASKSESFPLARINDTRCPNKKV